MSTSSVLSIARAFYPDGPGGPVTKCPLGRYSLTAVLLSLPLAAAPAGAVSEPSAFATTQACIIRPGVTEPWTLTVELAETPAQRAQGLMDRVALAANAGMLFRYPEMQPPTAGFWMPRVRFPLDIAYLDADGTVLAYRTMPPCPEPMRTPCPTYAAGVAFQAALEVNAGLLASHGVLPGRSRVLSCPSGATPR